MKLINRKIKENVTDPLKDKGRVMKLEYLLSNNYTIIAVVVIVDILVVLAIALVLGMISSLPGILSGVTDAGKLISVKSIVSVLSGITVGGAAVGLLLLAVIDVFLVYKIKVSWSDKAINVGQRGTDRFTTEDEIKDQYTAIEPLFTPYKGDPGILISRIGNTFYIDQMVVNNLLIGITRSGKGETEVKTSIEIYSRAENQPSLIVNDQKIELYKTFAPILRERGYKVYLLNASNPLLSMGFNLIGLAVQYYKKKDYDTAEQVTNSLAHSFFNVHYFPRCAWQRCRMPLKRTNGKIIQDMRDGKNLMKRAGKPIRFDTGMIMKRQSIFTA